MTVACSLVLLFGILQMRVPLFETDMGPGEGPHEYVASAKTLTLRELPLGSSKISKTVPVTLNQPVSFDDTRYRTIRSGRIRVLVATHVTGRMIGAVNRLSGDDYSSEKFADANVQVHSGMSFEYLQYRAEGTCFVRIDGRVIDAGPCPTIDKSMFKVETEPKTELWIHVVAPGNSPGWLLVTDSSVKLVNPELLRQPNAVLQPTNRADKSLLIGAVCWRGRG